MDLSDKHPPEAFYRRGDALISPYFKSIGRELGGTPERKVIEAKDLVKKRYARTRIQQLFKLTGKQFEEVLSDVGADTCWKPMFEEHAGYTFTSTAIHNTDLALLTGMRVSQ